LMQNAVWKVESLGGGSNEKKAQGRVNYGVVELLIKGVLDGHRER